MKLSFVGGDRGGIFYPRRARMLAVFLSFLDRDHHERWAKQHVTGFYKVSTLSIMSTICHKSIFDIHFQFLYAITHVISDSDELFIIMLNGFGDLRGYLGMIISLNKVTVHFLKFSLLYLHILSFLFLFFHLTRHSFSAPICTITHVIFESSVSTKLYITILHLISSIIFSNLNNFIWCISGVLVVYFSTRVLHV